MPWMIPAHPAPVLPLKEWRPAAFSGLGLVLGTFAPDLAFMLRLDTDAVAAHTFLGQLYVTVPLVLGLHWLATALVLPWLLPRLPPGPPIHPEELAAIRAARGWRDWGRVAVSGWIGGLTHVLLDGITHGNHSGWALAFLPFLRTPVPHLGGTAPLHDALHTWSSVVLGVAAVLTWQRLGRERRLWAWRGEQPPPAKAGSPARQQRFWTWMLGLALSGALVTPAVRADLGPSRALELAVYGSVAFLAYGLVLLAFAHQARRWLRLQVRPPTAANQAR